jgi:diguanylate cyclase (GGDEF)-like protein
MADYTESGTPVSMILADINRLKQVNDSFGHEAGDRLIVAVADAVSRASGLAHGSLAARIGGDEFCIVTTGVPAHQAVKVAEELCRIVDNQPMSTGVSCGVASTDAPPGPFHTPLRLFRLADAAQYRAKRSGSRTPVVAGSTAADVPEEAPTDRRARRGRLAVDGLAVLEAGYEVLDRLNGCSVQTRLEAMADHVLLLLDGAAWWVSQARHGEDSLVSVSSSVQRFAENLDANGIAQSEIGAQFALDDFPASRDAMRYASAFLVELVGDDGGDNQGRNDPAEEQSLVTAGYTCFLAAGATGAGSGWLLELYGDPISMSFAGFEPVLRALVTVAVAGGPQPVGDRPATTISVPASRPAPDADR